MELEMVDETETESDGTMGDSGRGVTGRQTNGNVMMNYDVSGVLF